MKSRILLSALLLFITFSTYSQVGINTSNPDPSAVLDILSTTQGVLYPRMTSNERNTIQSPATGLIIFNTSTGCLNIFNGLIWVELCGQVPADYHYIDGIYVSTNGDNTTGDGSPQNPYASVSKGYNELGVQDKDTLIVAGGDYYLGTLIMNLDTGLVFLGGFEDVYWTRDIDANPTNVDSGPNFNATVASSHDIYIGGINFIQSTSEEIDAAYGLYLYESSQIVIEDCHLQAGPGPNGLDGDPGLAGTPSTNGGNSNGGITGGLGGSIGGGNGGQGGLFGDGDNGSPGNGGAPGGLHGDPPGNGGNGANGMNGMHGNGGSSFGFPGIFYEPANGEDGTAGTNGAGGGGGGGEDVGFGSNGDGGGGGGGGGGAGAGGEKGLGGGGSFGLYAYNSEVVLTDCTLQSADGGDGGDGGNRGIGASGSPGGTINGNGGDGGNGGKGGNGGHGGGGGGGPSYAAYTVGSSVITLNNVVLIHGAPGAGGASMGFPGLPGLSGDTN